jgi:hypothetical protein
MPGTPAFAGAGKPRHDRERVDALLRDRRFVIKGRAAGDRLIPT